MIFCSIHSVFYSLVFDDTFISVFIHSMMIFRYFDTFILFWHSFDTSYDDPRVIRCDLHSFICWCSFRFYDSLFDTIVVHFYIHLLFIYSIHSSVFDTLFGRYDVHWFYFDLIHCCCWWPIDTFIRRCCWYSYILHSVHYSLLFDDPIHSTVFILIHSFIYLFDTSYFHCWCYDDDCWYSWPYSIFCCVDIVPFCCCILLNLFDKLLFLRSFRYSLSLIHSHLSHSIRWFIRYIRYLFGDDDLRWLFHLFDTFHFISFIPVPDSHSVHSILFVQYSFDLFWWLFIDIVIR